MQGLTWAASCPLRSLPHASFGINILWTFFSCSQHPPRPSSHQPTHTRQGFYLIGFSHSDEERDSDYCPLTLNIFVHPAVEQRGYCFSQLIAFAVIICSSSSWLQHWWEYEWIILWQAFNCSAWLPLYVLCPHIQSLTLLIKLWILFWNNYELILSLSQPKTHRFIIYHISFLHTYIYPLWFSLLLPLFDDGGISILWGLWAQRVCFCSHNPLSPGASI